MRSLLAAPSMERCPPADSTRLVRELSAVTFQAAPLEMVTEAWAPEAVSAAPVQVLPLSRARFVVPLWAFMFPYHDALVSEMSAVPPVLTRSPFQPEPLPVKRALTVPPEAVTVPFNREFLPDALKFAVLLSLAVILPFIDVFSPESSAVMLLLPAAAMSPVIFALTPLRVWLTVLLSPAVILPVIELFLPEKPADTDAVLLAVMLPVITELAPA